MTWDFSSPGTGEFGRGLGVLWAGPLFARSFSIRPLWRELAPRLPASQVLPDDPALIKGILDIE